MAKLRICKRDGEAAERERLNSSSEDLQMCLMFLLLTIQGCDLLNLLPFSDRHEPAGWESGRRLSVTFIFSRLLDSSAEVIKDRRAACSGVVCVGVWRESGRTREDGYL